MKISVYKDSRPKIRNLRSSHPFFSEPIVYKVYDDRIEFRHAGLDDRKRVLNPHYNSGGYTFTIPCFDLQLGVHEIDYEEGEDVVIINLE